MVMMSGYRLLEVGGCRRQGMGGGLHASGSMKNGDVGGADRLGSGDGRG